MLGVDLSLLRIRDKIPCTCEAQILGFEKGGVFSWGKDEPEMGEEEFYILSPDTEEEEFYILSSAGKETRGGISTPRIRKGETKSGISTPRIEKIRITLTVGRFDYRTKDEFLVYRE